jgi:hypothetical protein
LEGSSAKPHHAAADADREDNTAPGKDDDRVAKEKACIAMCD